MRSDIFDKISFILLFLVIILLPVFCLPFTKIPVETSKGFLLVLGLTVSVVTWAIARFLDGKIVFPKSWLLVSGFSISLVFLLSAIFSEIPQVSLFGIMFDTPSFWFIFFAFVLMLFSSIVIKTSKRAKIVLFGTVLSSAFVLVFQIFHLFMPSVLSLGILSGKTGNILGSWNTLGLFAGFSSLLFLLVVEFFPISRLGKIFLNIFIAFSIFLAAAVNFQLVWILLGISSLIIFVYKVSITLENSKKEEDEKNKKYFPLVSFIVVIISLLFFLSAGFVGNIIPNYLKVSNSEVNPSLGTTFSITKQVFIKDPLLGIGPNRFGEAWAMYKPAIINNTQFWNVSFNSGSGLLPSLTATTGMLGILAWLLFLVLFLFTGAKSVFSSVKNGVNWETMSFFVLSLYLFVSSFFYFTGVAVFLLAFAFTGIFAGLSASSSGKEVIISFLDNHKKSFFSILALIILVISFIAISFKYVERFISVSYFGKTLAATEESTAEILINKAVSLYSNDLYLRTYAQVYLVKLNSLATKGGALSDKDKVDLQTSLNQAVNGAQMAVAYNPQNYLNFESLGLVYQTAGSLGVKNAYTEAFTAYQTASALNPLNPGLKLAMANASFFDGKIKEAKDYAKGALELKPDYIDALLTLSQIAKDEGNNNEAIAYGEAALSVSPSDKNLINYVNSLKNPAPAKEPASDKSNNPKN